MYPLLLSLLFIARYSGLGSNTCVCVILTWLLCFNVPIIFDYIMHYIKKAQLAFLGVGSLCSVPPRKFISKTYLYNPYSNANIRHTIFVPSPWYFNKLLFLSIITELLYNIFCFKRM